MSNFEQETEIELVKAQFVSIDDMDSFIGPVVKGMCKIGDVITLGSPHYPIGDERHYIKYKLVSFYE